MKGRLPDSLEERVREGARGFEFDALLAGGSDQGSPDSERGRMASGRFTEERLHQDPSPARKPDARRPESQDVPTPGFAERRGYRLAPGRSNHSNRSVMLTALLAGLALGGWALYLRQPSGKPTNPIPSVPPTRPAAHASTAVPRLGLPRPELTPGERLPQAVEPSPVSDDVRRQVFQMYGIDPHDSRSLPVRLIPSELGGTNGVRNVFPLTPWFAELKSRLDAFLIRQVLENKMTPAQAVGELTTNWISSCHRHYIRNYGENDRDKARQTEDKLRWE